MAYLEWGQALFVRGDLAGASRQLALAHAKGPHFADPMKALGDVLMKQGRRREALVKYDQGLKYAPNWAARKQAREAAASST
jgi:Flp pilus assembly protein TadD